MNVKNTLQEHHKHLDLFRRQLAIAKITKDHKNIAKLTSEINQLTAQMSEIKQQQKGQLSDKAQKIVSMKFHRTLSKAEQADIGKLKKSVRGIILVHPTTALGKEIGVEELTGYAFKPF